MRFHLLLLPQTYVLLILVKDFIFIFVLLVSRSPSKMQEIMGLQSGPHLQLLLPTE